MTPRSINWLLGAGAACGALLAARGLIEAPRAGMLPADAVAVVNGKSIRRADYESALSAVAADRRAGADEPGTRRHVLERLIDEELLVQAGLELGLAERDRQVRADLARAAIGFVADAPDDAEPSEQELRAFYAEHAGYFASDVVLSVERAFFAGPKGRDEAEQARARVAAGTPFSVVASQADAAPLPLPSSELPLAKLEQYLGPTAARSVAELEPGACSEPMEASGGVALYRVATKHAGAAPAFERVKFEVRVEWQRRQSERRMRSFLDARRAEAKLVLAPELAP